MEWFDIKVVRPEEKEGNRVIGYNGNYIFECELEDDVWCNIGGDEMTHWAHYPELPKTEKQAKEDEINAKTEN